MGPTVTKKLPDRSSYKGPSNKEIFAGFQAMHDQNEEDRYWSGQPNEPTKLKMTPIKDFIRIKKKDVPAARMPKPQRAVAKINPRKAYEK